MQKERRLAKLKAAEGGSPRRLAHDGAGSSEVSPPSTPITPPPPPREIQGPASPDVSPQRASPEGSPQRASPTTVAFRNGACRWEGSTLAGSPSLTRGGPSLPGDMTLAEAARVLEAHEALVQHEANLIDRGLIEANPSTDRGLIDDVEEGISGGWPSTVLHWSGGGGAMGGAAGQPNDSSARSYVLAVSPPKGNSHPTLAGSPPKPCSHATRRPPDVSTSPPALKAAAAAALARMNAPVASSTCHITSSCSSSPPPAEPSQPSEASRWGDGMQKKRSRGAPDAPPSRLAAALGPRGAAEGTFTLDFVKVVRAAAAASPGLQLGMPRAAAQAAGSDGTEPPGATESATWGHERVLRL